MKNINAIWKEMPKEVLNDLPQISNYLDNSEMMATFEKLLTENNLDPNMYHPVLTFSEQQNDNFIKNRITVFISAVPNKPQS